MRVNLSVLFMLIMLLATGLAAGADTASAEPVGLAAYTLGLSEFDWQTRSSQHYRIHYLPGSVAERQIDTLLERNEKYIDSHLAILEADDFRRVIDLFYFDSRDQIEAVVTKPFRALADAENLTVLAVRNSDEVARDAHEIMHVVSFDLWGGWDRRSELAWLAEGLATYSDEPCNGYEMSELAANILMNTEDNVPLDSLARQFRKYPEMVGYMLMASFVEYVLDMYGAGKLRELWLADYDALESVVGKDAAAVEDEWHKYVCDKYPDPQVPNWSVLREDGCK